MELKVIDCIAKDIPDPFSHLDGRIVNKKKLQTRLAELIEIKIVLRERIFQRLWVPEVLYILKLIEIYGIISVLSNPGAIFPGVVGVVA